MAVITQAVITQAPITAAEHAVREALDADVDNLSYHLASVAVRAFLTNCIDQGIDLGEIPWPLPPRPRTDRRH